MKKLIILTVALLCAGCATVFQGPHQDLTITTTGDVEKNTTCVAQNEEGIWKDISPLKPVKIHRDGNPMSISCINSTQQGTEIVKPDFQFSYLVINFLLDGCIISCVVDGVSNSFYDYQTPVIVPMQKK